MAYHSIQLIGFILAIMVSTPTAFASKGRIISGSVAATKECTSKEAVVWVSQGPMLLYQLHVPVGGSFEAHVKEAPFYDVAVTEKSGCFAESKIKIQNANKVIPVKLVATPVSNKDKPDNRSPANSGMTPQGCPSCWGLTAGGITQPPGHYVVQPSAPWWSGYGMYAYANYAYPAPWSNYYVQGGYYPYATPQAWHHGGGFAGKPNLYISGKPGQTVKVTLAPQAHTQTLAAVPVLTKGAHWTAKTGSNGKLLASASSYDYLFYDYRLTLEHLQKDKGFCAARSAVVPQMAALLEQTGFTKNEVDDFKTYWTEKWPPNKDYCVYPQGSAELDKIVQLKITPDPQQITRILFFVVPTEAYSDPHNVITSRPKEPWPVSAAHASTPAGVGRTVAATGDGLRAREWGVAFIGRD
jgi:hypothetical protein